MTPSRTGDPLIDELARAEQVAKDVAELDCGETGDLLVDVTLMRLERFRLERQLKSEQEICVAMRCAIEATASEREALERADAALINATTVTEDLIVETIDRVFDETGRPAFRGAYRRILSKLQERALARVDSRKTAQIAAETAEVETK